MVINLNRPHIGACLTSKLLKISTSDYGAIHFGGMVTYHHPSCFSELLKDKRPDLEKITKGSHAQTLIVLEAS